MSTPLISQPSVAMRPWVELETSTSLMAVCRRPWWISSMVGRSTVSNRPSSTSGSRSARSFSVSDVRNPTRPKFTPITGTRVSRNRCRARSIVPSPPSTSTRSHAPDSSHGSAFAAMAGCLLRSSAGISSVPPLARTSSSTLPSASRVAIRVAVGDDGAAPDRPRLRLRRRHGRGQQGRGRVAGGRRHGRMRRLRAGTRGCRRDPDGRSRRRRVAPRQVSKRSGRPARQRPRARRDPAPRRPSARGRAPPRTAA